MIRLSLIHENSPYTGFSDLLETKYYWMFRDHFISVRICLKMISYSDQKLQNIYESNYVDNNSSVEGVAENLATFYLLYGDVNLINTEIEMYRSIKREEIRDAAKKYLNPNQRLILDYVPAKDKAELNKNEQAKEN